MVPLFTSVDDALFVRGSGDIWGQYHRESSLGSLPGHNSTQSQSQSSDEFTTHHFTPKFVILMFVRRWYDFLTTTNKIQIFIIIIIIIIVSFMQGIYTHIPETNFVPREYSIL